MKKKKSVRIELESMYMKNIILEIENLIERLKSRMGTA